MNLKGHTTIQLFNKDTGVLENEIQSDNLVTNAVSNLLNFDPRISLNSETGGTEQLQTGLMYALLTPIAEKLYGGLMIFGNTLTESADYIIPTQEDMASLKGYGCRQGSVAGNTKRGAFNVSESGITDTTATMVWDFTTEQSNGVLKAVALTSDWGGDSAWDNNSLSLAKTVLPFSYTWGITSLDRIAEVFGTRDLNNGCLLSSNVTPDTVSQIFTHNDTVLLVSATSDSGTEFKVYKKELGGDVGLNTKLDGSVTFESTTPILTFNASNIATRYKSGIISDGKTAIFTKVTEVYSGNIYTTTLDVLEISYDGTSASYTENSYILTGIRAKVFNDSDTYSRFGVTGIITSEYIYIIARTGEIYKILKSNTSVITQLPAKTEGNSGLTLMMFNDNVVLVDRHRASNSDLYTNMYILNEADSSWLTVPLNTYYGNNTNINVQSVKLSMIKDPFVNFIVIPAPFPYSYNTYRSYQRSIHTNFISAYLGTINNLETPVIKTSSQTMKVIYTLTTA